MMLILEILGAFLFQSLFDCLAWSLDAKGRQPSPMRDYAAVVREKREEMRRVHSEKQPVFRCRFATDDGEKDLALTAADYARLSEWQKGVLTLKNGAFYRFRPVGRLQLPQVVAHLKGGG